MASWSDLPLDVVGSILNLVVEEKTKRGIKSYAAASTSSLLEVITLLRKPLTLTVDLKRKGGRSLLLLLKSFYKEKPSILVSRMSTAQCRVLFSDSSGTRYGLHAIHLEPLIDALESKTINTSPFPLSCASTLETLDLSRSDVLTHLPPGLFCLRHLNVSGCRQLEPEGWFPTEDGSESGARIETLNISNTRISCIPGTLRALKFYDVSDCLNLSTYDWLPNDSPFEGKSSVGCVIQNLEILKACRSNVSGLPFTLFAAQYLSLREVNVTECTQLSRWWILPRSAPNLRIIYAKKSNIQALPEGLPSLVEFHARKCTYFFGGMLCQLNSDVGPFEALASAANLRRIDARGSNISSFPGNMVSLTHIDISGIRNLLPDWLPIGSRANVQVILAKGSNLFSLPDGLVSLKEIDISKIDSLIGDWLHPGSRGKVQELCADETNLSHLLPGFVSLVKLKVRKCIHLADDWLPEDAKERVQMGSLRIFQDSRRTRPPLFGHWSIAPAYYAAI